MLASEEAAELEKRKLEEKLYALESEAERNHEELDNLKAQYQKMARSAEEKDLAFNEKERKLAELQETLRVQTAELQELRDKNKRDQNDENERQPAYANADADHEANGKKYWSDCFS